MLLPRRGDRQGHPSPPCGGEFSTCLFNKMESCCHEEGVGCCCHVEGIAVRRFTHRRASGLDDTRPCAAADADENSQASGLSQSPAFTGLNSM